MEVPRDLSEKKLEAASRRWADELTNGFFQGDPSLGRLSAP
jgi:hypothetical protein